jgi:DMSO/TMAO reductase YedYZ molybdopterin-dependent catalytic subunit
VLLGPDESDAAALLDSGQFPGPFHPPRAHQFFPPPLSPTVKHVHLPPQEGRNAIGWTSLFPYQIARGALHNHEGNLDDLDKDTHLDQDATYQLNHFDVMRLDPAEWTLTVSGHVERPLTLDLAKIRGMKSVDEIVLLECAGNGRIAANPRGNFPAPWSQEAIGCLEYTGIRLADVLRAAGIRSGAVEVVFTGADEGVEKRVRHHFQRSLTIAEAMKPEVLLAYEANGEPLNDAHGKPLRLVKPHWYGMASVKWLTHIHVITHPFTGFQQLRSYRYTLDDPFDDPGRPVTRQHVRAAMKPLGLPDADTGSRWVDRGAQQIVGKAWSGAGRITSVEFSPDDGTTWRPAELGGEVSPWSWTRWSTTWTATPGEHILRCRARDSAGHVQPLHPAWNWLTMGMNGIEAHRVVVP